VDVSLTYGGQWNLFGAWMFANDSSNLFSSQGVVPAQNAHWNGGFVELDYNPIQLPKWLFIYRYDWITNTQQGTTTSDLIVGLPVPGNFNNVQSHTVMARYYIHQSTRTDLALHAEYNYYRDTAVGGGGGNLYGQTALVGFDFAF